MQSITISGTLLSDAMKCMDRNGRSFTRFTVTCGSEGVNGTIVYTHYRCTCFMSGLESLREGDQVFLSGRFTPSVSIDNEGNDIITELRIFVYQLSVGFHT